MSSAPIIYNRVYDLDYFDDTDMMLYIGDVWVDEVTSLQFICRQEKTPLFGYASQLFDATAAGHVIVQGAFTINYKEQGYLWAVLRRWFSMGPGAPGFSNDPLQKVGNKAQNLFSNKLKEETFGRGSRPIKSSNGTLVSRASIERLVQGSVPRQERYDFYHSLAGYASVNLEKGQAKDTVFEDIVEAFEDELWLTTDNDRLLEQVRRTDDNAFDDFDIYVTFGNYSTPGANHTAVKITGVRLLSQGKAIQIGGGCIQESYEFLGRSIV